MNNLKNMIALVDCQSFYASCETIFRPDQEGKPVVVLSNNDHWIIALNMEAKALGLKRGCRFKEAQPLIKKHKIAYFSSNYTLYNDISSRVMTTLREFSDRVEVYSIDEAFVHLGKVTGIRSLGHEIRDRIYRQVMIRTSVGIGPTRALAKVAQRLAKKHGGVLVLEMEKEIEAALRQTPIDDVWGIGRAYAQKFISLGLESAWDFVTLPEWRINKLMTVVGWRLHRELKGVPMNDLKIEASPRKGIISARQFGEKIRDLTLLQEALSQYVEIAVGKLRGQRCLTGLMSVSLESTVSYSHGSGRTLSAEFPPTDYLPFLLSTAKTLLERLYVKGLSYWRTTVFLFAIVPRDGMQMELFEYGKKRSPRDSVIMDTMDGINRKYGKSTIRCLASKATQDWNMRREFLSPCYTSRLEDLPLIHAE